MTDAVIDRSRDISQPLDRLGPDETMKANSRQLRGSIAAGLEAELTAAVPGDDIKLMKFHGLYQQDNRDIRDERRRRKMEPAYRFMARVRLPGGVLTPAQWLKLDELARRHAGESLRLTTRQTFQLHHVRKQALRPVIQGLRDVLLDTRAACGDDTRGVMASINPELSNLHAEVLALAVKASNHAAPKTGAYDEIWYGAEHKTPDGKASGTGGKPEAGPEEPLYGATYLPRKFKIGFVIPPINDIDVYAQDLGFIAITDGGELKGFNVAIGGGMGRTDNAPATYPRLASVIGFIPKHQVIAVCDAVIAVQRDYGDRVDRSRARFKYTIDDKGLDAIRALIEARLGYAFEPARPYAFTSNGDALGWRQGEDGRWHFTLRVQNGRISNFSDLALLDALRAVARRHTGRFRVTPNQNLVIADIEAADRPAMTALLRERGLDALNAGSGLRRNSMACVAFPTCGLAMAESERYLPALVDKIDAILGRHGLENEPVTIRMTGCPNGCARPYIAEIGLTGRAPGKYNLYLGGGFHGQRLNKMALENVGEQAILDYLDGALGRYAGERVPGEHFGDFAIRIGLVPEVLEGRRFND